MKNNRIKLIIIILTDILMAVLFSLAIIYCMRLQDSMRLNVYFGESHAGLNNIGQLFYAENKDDFSGNNVMTVVFEDNLLTFDISEIDFSKNVLRLDPFNMKREFSIKKIELCYGDFSVFSINGKELKSYAKAKGMSCEATDEGLICHSKKKNPRLIFKRKFSDKIYRYYFILNRIVYLIIGALILCVGLVQVVLLRRRDNVAANDGINISMEALDIMASPSGVEMVDDIEESDNDNSIRKTGPGKACIPAVIITGALVGAASGFIYALRYFEGHFGQVPFGQLVYHLHTPLDGTDISSYRDVIIIGVLLVVVVVIVNIIIYNMLLKHRAHYGYVAWVTMLSVILLVCSLYRGIIHYQVIEYYRYTHESTALYDDYYVDGRDTSLTFPAQKRNLIYIFLESMEMSFADVSSGGGMPDNLIPNLTELALNNECFSDGSMLNGAHQVSGATYTMGALAAQTSGTSINESIVSVEALNGTWDSENNYLPGVYAIGDVLKEQGYNQEFLIGSEGKFAGRTSYFRGHGDYLVEDYSKAIEEGRIPSDYKVWWGYEDEKLFQFAKEDILKLANKAEPFNFTMLTVDTHFTDGYRCDLCDDKYESQYSNVIACSDGQVAEFIEWVMAQDFYDNTTIVICGDHATPDSFYISEQGLGLFDRRTYTAILNPADGKKYNGNGRVFTTLDLYPTTLSAMGVDIEGDRLGLGVNLYSDTPTLAEEIGMEALDMELLKNSDYYKEKLLYK